jgi:hypothetical protein
VSVCTVLLIQLGPDAIHQPRVEPGPWDARPATSSAPSPPALPCSPPPPLSRPSPLPSSIRHPPLSFLHPSLSFCGSEHPSGIQGRRFQSQCPPNEKSVSSVVGAFTELCSPCHQQLSALKLQKEAGGPEVLSLPAHTTPSPGTCDLLSTGFLCWVFRVGTGCNTGLCSPLSTGCQSSRVWQCSGAPCLP